MIFVDPSLALNEQRAQYGALLEKFTQLVNTPAWAEFDGYLEQEQNAAFDAMQRAGTGDLAMKAIGAYVAISNIRRLAGSVIENARKGLKELAK